jgi:hypothetical protein
VIFILSYSLYESDKMKVELSRACTAKRSRISGFSGNYRLPGSGTAAFRFSLHCTSSSPTFKFSAWSTFKFSFWHPRLSSYCLLDRELKYRTESCYILSSFPSLSISDYMGAVMFQSVLAAGLFRWLVKASKVYSGMLWSGRVYGFCCRNRARVEIHWARLYSTCIVLVKTGRL